MSLLDDLTPAQRTAVQHVDGPLLVLAGPGSGKTRVITRRVAYLVSVGIPPWQILAVTFTNKAAGEMRERIDALIPPEVPGRRGLVVSTFHAFCARLLRRYAVEAGLDPGFVIYDSADQRELVKQAIEELEIDQQTMSPASAHAVIGRAKNDLLDAHAFAQRARDYRERLMARVFVAYERALATCNAVDFDDLLLHTARLLSGNPQVQGELSERFRYLLVDEYQDTNQAQFAIARAIAAPHGNICVVGDPDQSIYGWRGADLRNILHFEERFPNTTIVPLGENFRSTGHIVAASAALIACNLRRPHKELFTSLGDGPRVRLRECGDEHEEARALVADLRELAEDGIPWRNIAVLYRINALSRVLEESLREAGLPYLIVRGTAFFDRKEVRDALAYLRLVANPADAVSLARVVNFPPRGLGDTSLGRVQEAAHRWGVTLLEGLRRADEVEGLPPRARAAALGFVSMVDRWRSDALSRGGGSAAELAECVSGVLRESGLVEHYGGDAMRRSVDDGEDRLANLDELLNAASGFEPPASESEQTAIRPLRTLVDRLAAWLEAVALVSDADAVDASQGAITLMTLHAAKGLEFDAVAIVGLEEGLLPHLRFGDAPDDDSIEEERRLCYVGMTRARCWLTMSWAHSRSVRGRTERRLASSFLRELPREHVEVFRSTAAPGWGSGSGFGRQDAGAWSGQRDQRRGDHRRGEQLRGEQGRGGEFGRPPDLDGVDEIPDYEAGDVPARPAGRSSSSPPGGGGMRSLRHGLTVGSLVRHAVFGIGRVEAIMPRGASSTARINFETAGPKNLVLEYAKLERLE